VLLSRAVQAGAAVLCLGLSAAVHSGR
jgi:hypothetical protein